MTTADERTARRRFSEAVSDLAGEPTPVNVARYLRASSALDGTLPGSRRPASRQRGDRRRRA